MTSLLGSCLILFATGFSQLHAQGSRTITGVVYSQSDGNPLAGVSVTVKNGAGKATTDDRGRFSILLDAQNDLLLFSHLAFEPQEVQTRGRNTLVVRMDERLGVLDEAVVVGYGTIQRRDLTGSISQYKNKNVAETNAADLSQMLMGKVAGVQIVQNSGMPGTTSSFNIRGVNSTGGGRPLFVIDGVPVENNIIRPASAEQATSFYLSEDPPTDVLAGINPNEIASVEVLKDASATAIYGSRGANGVVLITTKTGQSGRTEVSYNFRTDISRLPRTIDVLGTAEFLEFYNEAYINDTGEQFYADSVVDRLLAENINVNWQNEVFRTSVSQDHQLQISGGNDQSKFSLVGSYANMQGIVTNSNYDRKGLRFNYNRKLSDRAELILNLSGSSSKRRALPQGHSNITPGTSVVLAALTYRPIDVPYTEEDVINEQLQGNPITTIYKQYDVTSVNQLISSLKFNYQIYDGLTFRFNGGVNYGANVRDVYFPRGTNVGDQNNGKSFYSPNSNSSFLTEYTLNYNKRMGRHNINSVAGYTWQSWSGRSFSIAGWQYPNDNLRGNDISYAGTLNQPRSSMSTSALASVIFRTNYSYASRYILTLTGRADGSTRLAPGKKWAYFPSIGLGWNVNNEPFFPKNSLLSELKLRGSWGVSGNQSVGVGSTQARLNSAFPLAAPDGSWLTAIVYSSLSNPDLGWENTYQTNVGLDAGFAGDRYRVAFDLYKKTTEGLLISKALAQSTGFGSYTSNAGEVENKGFEFQASAAILRRTFSWDVNVNLSANRNKLVHLDDVQLMQGMTYLGPSYNQPFNAVIPGQPIGVFYGYRTEGLYQNAAEISSGPEPSAKPGDIKYLDISGPDGQPDGVVNESDRAVIGNPYPDFTFGIVNSMEYKGVSVSFVIQGMMGQDVANVNRVILSSLSTATGRSISKEAWEGRWRGEGTSNYYPRASTGPLLNARASDFVIEDASFVRLRTLTLAYTVPIRRQLKSVRLFATANNLLTLTKYKGFDPEVNTKGSSAINQGIDIGTVPVVRSFSLGLNVNF